MLRDVFLLGLTGTLSVEVKAGNFLVLAERRCGSPGCPEGHRGLSRHTWSAGATVFMEKKDMI